jgi:hypothetical protein
MKVLKFIFIVLCIGLALTGCASKYMQPVDPEIELSYVPSESEAVIIFMRPSAFGGAVQSSVFDTTTGENVLVGIISSKAKVAYKTAPGEHIFMVVGENADFMGAEVEAGKKYYALVTPRVGFWKARFSLKPIHRDELASEKFKTWYSSCNFVENTNSSYQWAQENASSIQSKRVTYFQKWMSKPEMDRPVLYKEDGM